MDKAKTHFFLIDSFRGIASVWILALHILPSYLPDINWLLSFIKFGRIGTDFFFVASGYVSAIACHKILSSDKNNGFALKRLKKIYSIYLFSLLLALIIVPILTSCVSFLKSKELIFDFNLPTISDFFLYISLTKVFTSETWALNKAFVEISGVYWFIAVMVQIYLLLGIALKFKNQFYYIISVTFFLSLLCLFDDLKSLVPIGLFLPLFSKFFIGMVLYFCILKRDEFKNKTFTLLLAVVCGCLFGVIIYLHINALNGDGYRLLCAFTISLLLYLMYPMDSIIKNSLIGKATFWLGSFSYSTYLNHIIFWPFMYMFVSNLIPLPLSVSAPLVLVPLIILCCFVAHKLFDNPGFLYYVKKVVNIKRA
ncbi:acyltransferase [Alteromonas sp. 5E99-2]|uniref:acyltransferase family protein n=1 Tax=Alteromonas sp. 5E99-2 TaxID=2817683 RepID=UPI001A9A28F4|nr:acyltransferase [Alteromonas sp. 5E99-2]MBO1255979.1 acyltransferase [Alteromonas sp. 5E99-2]